MNVREATDDDVPSIQRVAERSWEHDYPGILSRETLVEGVHEWYSDGRLGDELAKSDSHLLVAERNGAVAGFVHAVLAGDEGDVLRVYVDPDHRGEAVGSALLEAAVATMFEHGAVHVRAMVLAENEPGQAFYRSHGFEREDESDETEIAGERYEEYRYVLGR